MGKIKFGKKVRKKQINAAIEVRKQFEILKEVHLNTKVK